LFAALHAAGSFDPTVRVGSRDFQRILLRHVPAIPYRRALLFEKMLAGEPVIVTGFPSPARGVARRLPPAEAGAAIMTWLGRQNSRASHRIFTGATGVRRRLTLAQIAAKWRADRTRFGVTDLHIRGTKMEDVIAPDVLSRFNLLPHSSPGAQAQEMFSFVISTRGHVTDSHSDDPDSSNYCFTGRKLWLVWDTYEGATHGLQDVERIPLSSRAHFDMEAWLNLRSARWFLVNAGETLFLPAHLTHKVITLERYIGVGGFFIALPNCLRLMAHWIARGPLWSKRDSTGECDELLMDIAQTVRSTVRRLRRAAPGERRQWGHDYLERSAETFLERCREEHLKELWSDPRFRCVAESIEGFRAPPSGPNRHHGRRGSPGRQVELPAHLLG
jgi:hypothetical protein